MPAFNWGLSSDIILFMGIIELRNVTKSFAGNVVLDGIDIEIFQNETTALIGRNGSGKTTVFNIIAGLLDIDSGSVHIRDGLVISYLSQMLPDMPEATAGEIIKTAFKDIDNLEILMNKAFGRMKANPGDREAIDEYGRLHDKFEFMGGYNTDEKFNRIVKGLSMPGRIIESPFDDLSGGERTTVMLARTLLCAPDVLLLDEPTNHLDMDARMWLEEFLASYRGSAVYISHDRYFINRTAGRVVEITGRKAYSYKGNYSSYKKQKQDAGERDLKLYERQAKEIERLNETALRLRNYATEKTIHIAKTIEKRIEHINRIDRPVTEKTLQMAFTETKKEGREMLRGENLSKRYGDKLLFQDVDFLVRSGERIAIIGPNGSGKSTLVRIMTGGIVPDSGFVRKGRGVKLAYLEQDIGFRHTEATVLEEVCAELGLSNSSARNLLGKYLFTGEDVFKKTGVLSGGEKSRLRLLLEMQGNMNLLILDEPTNHLDIASREELEKAIGEFGGTMVFISHDRHFINSFADRIFEIRDSKFQIYEGNYDDYINSIAPRETGRPGAAVKKIGAPRGKTKRKADFTIRTTEERILEIEGKIAEVEENVQRFASDYEKLTELTGIREELREELNGLYERWVELTDENDN
ncbi:MAG: ABC-F family ATP-binding cassette domain-containing protein [Clostridia bacterium]|nr:ABC-F family ATP-binding cassette domain-containing protein [Clostridia bacterium]